MERVPQPQPTSPYAGGDVEGALRRDYRTEHQRLTGHCVPPQ